MSDPSSDRPPERSAEAPSDAKSEDVAEAAEDVGEAPEDVGEAPEDVGEAPEDVAEAAEDVDVKAALDQIKAAARQRVAENVIVEETVREAQVDGLPLALRQMFEAATLREPVIRSHRRLVGQVVVFFKKAGFHLFAKWYIRPIVEQQEAFNRAAFRALRDLQRGDKVDAGQPGAQDPNE